MENKLNLAEKGITLFGFNCDDINQILNVFKICEHYAYFSEKIILTDLLPSQTTETGIKIINVDRINSTKEYSYFMIKKLNDYIKTKFVLIVQWDGFILNPTAWTDDFLKYDYVGAPWWFNDGNNVGNGGFNLRSKKLIEMLQNDDKISKYYPEDNQICRTYGSYLKSRGIKFAPEKIAARFSIEGHISNPPVQFLDKYGDTWNGEFGFHGLRKTILYNWKDKDKFFTKENWLGIPDYKIIKKINNKFFIIIFFFFIRLPGKIIRMLNFFKK